MAGRNKPVNWLATCCASLMLSSSLLHATPLVLYYNAQQKPKAWIDEQQQPKGFSYEIAASILNKAQIDFTAKAVPFMRGINSAKLCDGIMTGVFKTQQRELFLNYSASTVPDKAVVVSRIEDEFNYRDINDIMNHKVIYLRGASFGNAFAAIESKLNKVTHQNPAMMLRLLARKRVDLAILNPGLAAVKSAAQAANIDINSFRVSSIPLAEVDNYLVYCKDAPKIYDPLFQRINEAIKILKQERSFAEIMKKY